MGGIANAVGDIVGGAVDAVGSAIGAVADGVGSIAGGALGGISSIFGDVLEGVGGAAGGIFDAVGGIVGGAADFLNPLNFFENVGGLASDLLPGPLGDIAGAVFNLPGNIAGAIGGFAEGVFSGDLIGSIGKVVGDATGAVGGAVGAVGGAVAQGADGLIGAFETNLDKMNSIFDQITSLDPESKTYQADLLRLQNSLEQLTQANTMISQMLSKLNELSERIIQNMR